MTLAVRSLHRGICLNKLHVFPVLHASFSSASGPPRQISPNLWFHTTPDGATEQGQRPLVLLYSWLVAKAKHMHKFGDFYLQEGCDVLHVKLSPGELMRPTKGHAVVRQILDFADKECPEQPLIAHGFSVGCYLYAETLVHMLNDARYTTMAGRLRAQILDSPVDFQGVPFGVANVLTTHPILRKVIEQSLRSYLAAFRQSVTQHYQRASETIAENSMKTPSLVLYSKADVVASCERNEAAMKEWRDKGITVHSKCWPDSSHVGHYLKYPEEYIAVLSSFLNQVMQLDQQQQQRERERIVMSQ